MKMKNRILSDLIPACTIVLYACAAGAAPKGAGEPLSITEPTVIVSTTQKASEFLHRMPLDQFFSTDSSGIQYLYGREYTRSVTAGTGLYLLPKPEPAPRLFAHAEGNERFFWLKPPVVPNSNKAGKKKPDQLFSLKPASMSEDSMEERIRTGVYQYNIITKSSWRDWIQPEELSDRWDGFLIYGTDAAPVTLISFNF